MGDHDDFGASGMGVSPAIRDVEQVPTSHERAGAFQEVLEHVGAGAVDVEWLQVPVCVRHLHVTGLVPLEQLAGVVVLSNGAQTVYTGFATLVRFNPSGNIDARNGGAYAAASTIPYSAGVSYHFRLAINVTNHTYSIFVTPAGGAEQTVGTNFAFRTEQNTVTQLNWWGAFVGSTTGSTKVCGFAAQ